MRDVELYDAVRIKATGEKAFVVWFDEDDKFDEFDSYLLEISKKNEMPHFYRRTDFEKIEE